MSKEQRRAAALAATRAAQAVKQPITKPNAPVPPPVAPATIVPPAVPPAPPTAAELEAAAAGAGDATPTQAELDEAAAFEAEQQKQIKDADASDAIAAQESVQEGRDAVDAKRPVTDSIAEEDLDARTDEEKATDARLLAQALADEAAGKGETPRVQAKAAVDVVLIHNTTASPHGIAIPHVAGEKRNVATHPLLNLLPGVNEIARSDWAKALKQKMVQIHLDEGMYVELDANSITDAPDRKALELIDLTVNKALLQKWAGLEKRPKVREAIAAQLQKIAPSKRKKDPDEDEDEDQE